MINDPELKAMSEVMGALQTLDSSTQKRVVEWVLAKLQSTDKGTSIGTKRRPKPGSKKGRKAKSNTGGESPTKRKGAKRGPKPGTGGRPTGAAKKSPVGRRGRPRKNLLPVS